MAQSRSRRLPTGWVLPLLLAGAFAANAESVELATISGAARGYVALTDESQGLTRMRAVDGLHIVDEWVVRDFRVRMLDLVGPDGSLLVRGVPPGEERSDHFITRLYRPVGGELVVEWTSEALPEEVRSSADIGISRDGDHWFTLRGTASGTTLFVGDITSDQPAWSWHDERSGLAVVRFLGGDGERLLIERVDHLVVVERDRGVSRALPVPPACVGGVSRARVGPDAVWAKCQTLPKHLVPTLNQAQSPAERKERLRELIASEDPRDLYVAYPLEALDEAVLFAVDDFLSAPITTLWVTREGVAVVDATTGELRGLRLEDRGARVVPTGLRTRLDPRFASGRTPEGGPFADIGWHGDALVELDEEGGVRSIVTLGMLRSSAPER